MYYKNLYIRDFGIFNNQNLNDISKKLVVIGGKNRAGKSTFLKLLRYLPYGLPNNNSIPPASNQYYIEAELENNNKRYNLFLNGYSKPEVIDQNQKQYTTADLFNNLDPLSYRHLFSISLDELQDLSKIAKGKKKEKRLYSILLGAGFSELVKVPEIADKYHNNAKNIGGLLGDPAVASFKPDYNEIKSAEEMRDEALLEVKEFSQKREDLKQNQQKLKNIKQKLKKLENDYFLLDLLKNNYSELEKIEAMKIKLTKSAAPANFNSDNLDSEEKMDELLLFIKSHSKHIKSYYQKEEVLKEKINNYQLQKNKLENDFQILITEIQNLNSSWQEPLKTIEKMNLDLIEENKLNQLLAKYRKLNAEIEKNKTEINNLKLEAAENESELEDIKFTKPETILKRSYIIITFSFISLAASFFINFNQLRYLSLIIALVAFIYYSSNYKSARLQSERAEKIKTENQRKNNRIQEINIELNKKVEQLDQIKIKLKNYAQILGIAENDYLNFIDSYFREIKDKKRRYKKLKIEEKENKKKRTELEESIETIRQLISNSAKYCRLDLRTDSVSQIIENSDLLFRDLNLLIDLVELSENYLSKKAQLKSTLRASDKIKTALNKEGKDQFKSFVKLYQEFSSLAAVEKKKNLLSEEITLSKQNKNDLVKEITTLKNKINKLSTSTKIEKAQQKIDQAQNNLEKKAKNYAVNKSVSFILKKLRSRMIEKAEKELLKPAADILSTMTNQHYRDLKTTADLDQSDFKIITENGREFESVQQLSRGSLEQLFLAVRISRIKEINPPLPIVLDDSLVNFDHSHLYNTAELISKLSNRNQIFILTCHPHLVAYINEITDSAQYWKLESGEFELSDNKELINYLNYNS